MVLASSEKLGAVSPCLVASLDSVDAIISEVAPSDALRQQLEAAGVETIRAR